jgi:DNA-binding transcriptional regulator YiaG
MTLTDDDALALVRMRLRVRTGDARQLRVRDALKVAEVAQVVGVSAAAVSRWEHGQRVPGGSAALKYARLLDRLAGTS